MKRSSRGLAGVLLGTFWRKGSFVHVRATEASRTVCFGEFTVSLRTGDVHRRGVPIALQEQPRRILIRLLQAPGTIVTRDELRACLWTDDTFVDFEHSLNAAVKRLRDALGDSASEPRFIETIPQRGHRFIAPVRPVDENPAARAPGFRRTAAVVVVVVLAVAGSTWLLKTARSSPAAPRAIASDAYDAYLQGVSASRRWQAGGCLEAERHLTEAIAIDPTLADAYAHLADCYTFPDRTRRPGWETFPKARAAVARALALDPDAALAHVVQGRIHLLDEFDWAAAEREFRKAVELNPTDSQALIAYGELLYASGRVEPGLASMRDALRLDALNMDHQTGYGFALRSLRRFDEAAEQFRRTLEEDPRWTSARFWLACTEADRGRQDAAVTEYLAFLAQVVVPGRVDRVGEQLARAYRDGGWLTFWREEAALAEEDNRAPGSVWRAPASYYSGPFSMARRYARVGDRTAALDWLEKAFTYRHHLMPFIGLEPLFDTLHEEPRFRVLRRKVGLR